MHFARDQSIETFDWSRSLVISCKGLETLFLTRPLSQLQKNGVKMIGTNGHSLWLREREFYSKFSDRDCLFIDYFCRLTKSDNEISFSLFADVISAGSFSLARICGLESIVFLPSFAIVPITKSNTIPLVF